MLLLSPAPSVLPCLGCVKTNKSKREPCKLSEKERDTSSKIVVWCVRCPHVRPGRCTAVSPSTVPVLQPNHTYTAQQAGRQPVKPSRTRITRRQHNTTPQRRQYLLLCSRVGTQPFPPALLAQLAHSDLVTSSILAKTSLSIKCTF